MKSQNNNVSIFCNNLLSKRVINKQKVIHYNKQNIIDLLMEKPCGNGMEHFENRPLNLRVLLALLFLYSKKKIAPNNSTQCFVRKERLIYLRVDGGVQTYITCGLHWDLHGLHLGLDLDLHLHLLFFDDDDDVDDNTDDDILDGCLKMTRPPEPLDDPLPPFEEPNDPNDPINSLKYGTNRLK